MVEGATRWIVHGVLLFGALLRIGLLIATPSKIAHDNHFQPIEIVANQRRLPKPDECWECYQPPLYYVTSAVPYAFIERALIASGSHSERAVSAARKTVQALSTLYGIATLWICWRILRRLPGISPPVEAVALALPALLPQHLYMSAMVTNDALAYLHASLTILFALRLMTTHRSYPAAILTGVFAGLTILTKGYGWMTAVAVLASMPIVGLLLRRHSQQRPVTQPTLLRAAMIVALCTIGASAAILLRNQRLYGRVHVDNFDFFETPMKTQPPGDLASVQFLSFRYFSLLQRPWVHTSHLASFPTQLFARYWFDYEGLTVSLSVSNEWKNHQRSIKRNRAGTAREDWDRLLNWSPPDVPGLLMWVGRASYLAGLPLTLAVLAGIPIALRHFRKEPVHLLMLLHLPAYLFVPLFQTIRLPCISAMKSAFTLGALSSAAWLLALVLLDTSGRVRIAMTSLVWTCLAVVALSDCVFIAYMAARTS